ncbi:MAG: hypothetical protein RIQ79_855, partial [Verrucomicrobiota bacterium]
MSVNEMSFDAPLSSNEPMLLAWLRQAVDAHAIVAMTDPAGVIRHVNDRLCEISGYKREELIGQTHRLLKSGYHDREFFEKMWATISGGDIWQGTICNRAKDGSLYWVESTIMPLLGLAGRPLGYLALRTDVSQLIDTERELALKTKEMQLLFDHSPIGLSWREIDADGKPGFNHVNRRFCELIGLSSEDAADLT